MKTKILLKASIVLVLLFLGKTAFLQNYMPLPDSGAVWVVEETSSELWLYTKYFFPNENRDTIINGEVYHKIFTKGVYILHPWPNPSDPFFLGQEYYGACRSDDSGRSWLNLAEGSFPNQDILFMDMTVEKGDTLWQIPTYSTYGSEHVFSDLVVDSTDQVESGTLSRKRVFLRNLNPPNGMECPFIWVEGIGNIASGLLNAADCGFVDHYLNCMSISDTIMAGYLEVYQNPSVGVCDLPFLDNIDLPSLSEKIIVYPNPANEYVVFETQKPYFEGTIQITDITGRHAASLPLTAEKTVWQTGGMEAGVFLYRVKAGNTVATGKLVLAK